MLPHDLAAGPRGGSHISDPRLKCQQERSALRTKPPIKSRPDQDNHKTAKLGIPRAAVAQFLKHLSNNLVVSDCREYFPRISLFQAGQRGLTRNTGSGGVLLKIFVDIDPNWSEQAMLGISFHRPFLAD